jgi:hypothetical protein
MGERSTLRLVAEYADACNLFDLPDGRLNDDDTVAAVVGRCRALASYASSTPSSSPTTPSATMTSTRWPRRSSRSPTWQRQKWPRKRSASTSSARLAAEGGKSDLLGLFDPTFDASPKASPNCSREHRRSAPRAQPLVMISRTVSPTRTSRLGWRLKYARLGSSRARVNLASQLVSNERLQLAALSPFGQPADDGVSESPAEWARELGGLVDATA